MNISDILINKLKAFEGYRRKATVARRACGPVATATHMVLRPAPLALKAWQRHGCSPTSDLSNASCHLSPK